jgi:hypothetical protein
MRLQGKLQHPHQHLHPEKLKRVEAEEVAEPQPPARNLRP